MIRRYTRSVSEHKQRTKSRKGSLPINIETLIGKESLNKISCAQVLSFSSAFMKLGRDDVVTRSEAREAKKVLKKGPDGKRVRETAVAGGISAPAIFAASRGVKGFADTPGNLKKRLVGAGREIAKHTKGDYLAAGAGGAATGAVYSGAREGFDLLNARRTYNDYMERIGLRKPSRRKK